MSSLIRTDKLLLAVLLPIVLGACASAPTPIPPPPFIPPPQRPQCYEESYYVGQYSAARQFEDAYFASHDNTSGTKALDLFASYLECAPTGPYAISAHLRKARLHCALGQVTLGKEQLRRLSEHPQAGGSEVIDAKYVFDFCAGLVDFSGRRLGRDGPAPPR